jgi:hypothetical protein
VICLSAPPDVAAQRVSAREPDSWPGKAALIKHARKLAREIPCLPGTQQAPRQEDVPDLGRYGDRAAITGVKNTVDADHSVRAIPAPLAHENHHGPTAVACELDSRRHNLASA